MNARDTSALTQRHGWWWCAAAAVLFGASTPATKFLVDDAGAMSLAGLLYLGAAIGVAPFVERHGRRTADRSQRIRLMTWEAGWRPSCWCWPSIAHRPPRSHCC